MIYENIQTDIKRTELPEVCRLHFREFFGENDQNIDDMTKNIKILYKIVLL